MVTIRELDEARDLAGLGRLVVELQEYERGLDPRLPQLGPEGVDEYIALMLRRCEEYQGKTFVAELEGELVGYVCILARITSDDPEEGPKEHGLVADLMVRSDQRGQGLGRRLLDTAQAYARECDTRWFRIMALASNRAARSLYFSYGFRDYQIQLEMDLSHRPAEHPQGEGGSPRAAGQDIAIETVGAASMDHVLDGLVDLLIDSVEHGASVGYVLVPTRSEASVYWESVRKAVSASRSVLFVAKRRDALIGTVQLSIDPRANAIYRGEVSKLLVHSGHRRLGAGRRLMQGLATCARERGLRLLVLDTRSGDPSQKLYESLGYRVVGEIPSYAVAPGGKLVSTTVMYLTL